MRRGEINNITIQNFRLYLKETFNGFSLIVSATTSVKGTKGEITIAKYQQVSSVKAKAEFDKPISSGVIVIAKVVTVIII